MSRISTATKDELVKAIGERYRAAPKTAKLHILDEFIAVTGYHRKHAIRVLCGATTRAPSTRERVCIYDEAVREALIVLWEASDRVCGKRLKPLLPLLIGALERHGHLHLDETVRTKVLAASAATIDRLLAGPRASASGQVRPRKNKPAIRGSIAVRTFADWKDPPPGFLEIDLVAHCGDTVAGSFAHTLVLTDIASGWTECIPLLVREATLVVDAVERIRRELPFAMRGLDADNGSEFINDDLLAYCRSLGLEFTRSRPYHKNDQAWVEQKNGAIVRRLVGYGRLEGIAATEALSRLFGASRLFVNFFQPSFKLAEKIRIGARINKRYHSPETPCSRLLASDTVSDETKERLRAVVATLDPLRLLDEIRTVQHHIAALAAGQTVHVLQHRDADLERLLQSFATAWRDGEVRPTHRRELKPARWWRTRKDPFERVWPRIVVWLETDPGQTAKDLLARLHTEYGESFEDRQLRTLQRRVKEWRRSAARRLLFIEENAGPI